MLQELLPASRIKHIQSAKNWGEAIWIASRPLLFEGSIQKSYVERMVQSVKDHGPYIVLADFFALPHAAPGEDVREVAMSLLVLDEAVDLEGNPVKIFLVLAAVDNHSHLEALSEISELLMEEENFQTFLSGDARQIRSLIEKGER